MTKLVALGLALLLCLGLSAAGCYLQSLLEVPEPDPFVEELNAVRVRYVLEIEEVTRSLRDGAERERRIGRVREAQRRAEESVYARHGRALPPPPPPGPPW